MGRRRSKNFHLPPRMAYRHGAYYHLMTVGTKQQWLHLSRDYGVALSKWAEYEGRNRVAARTLSQLITEYLAASVKRLASETLRGYQNSAKRIGPRIGDMPLSEVTRPVVYRYLIEAGNIAANRDRALIGAAFTHAINTGWTGANPAHGLRFRVKEIPRKRYVEDAELERLIAAASPRFGLLIRFAYLTGMSEGDVCRLKLTAATKEGVHHTRQKNEAEGLIAWSDELETVWKAAAGARIGAQPLFPARGGGHYTESGLRAVWGAVRERAGLPDIRFHDLRRKAGSDVEEAHATELLQHGDGAVTRKHYRAKLKPVKPVR